MEAKRTAYIKVLWQKGKILGKSLSSEESGVVTPRVIVAPVEAAGIYLRNRGYH